MSEELKIIANEDGTFSEYDDTFDITIHCQSEEEQNEVLATLNAPQLCGDCISREKALQIIRAWFDREATPSDLKNEIEQLPPAPPQPKMGKWKAFTHSAYHGNDEDGEPIWREVTVYHCDLCNRRTVIKEKYCPNCGAKMQEVEQ